MEIVYMVAGSVLMLVGVIVGAALNSASKKEKE